MAVVSHQGKGTMKNRLISVAVAALLATTLAQPAAAQTEKGDVAFGYQFINLSADGDSQSLPAGWFVDMAGNLNRVLAVVAHVGGNYKSVTESATFGGASASATADIKLYQFMGGVRMSSRTNPTVVPFGHFLAGATYGSGSFSGTGNFAGQTFALSGADSRTNFAIQVGGGTNIGMTSTLGIRFGVDYLRIFSDDGGANAFRFGAGVNVKF